MAPETRSASEISFDVAEEEDDRPKDLVAAGKLNGWSLTFRDRAVEEQFCRNLDDQNIWPATLCISLAFGFLVAHMLTASSFLRSGIVDSRMLRNCIGGSNIFGITCCAVPLVILRRRWCTGEAAALCCAMLVSITLFTSNSYYLSEILDVPGDFMHIYYSAEVTQVMSLAIMSSGLHAAINVRSSRSWILPVFQVVVFGTFRSLFAPGPIFDTAFLCLMYILVGFLAWRGRRIDERRMRIDHLEKHELRLAMTREREIRKTEKARLQEIEDRLKAMDSWAGRSSTNSSIGSASKSIGTGTGISQQVHIFEQDLTVPRPSPQLLLLQQASFASDAPNRILQFAMGGRCADAARIRKMAERVASSDYSIREFFDDCIFAFPELELFFAAQEEFAARSIKRAKGEKEYQRTMCALFSVYWLLRMDSDGKRGFCLGMNSAWEVRDLGGHSSMDITDSVKREDFLESADWAKMLEMVVSSLGGEGDAGKHLDIERIEAMLCLTAFHDILKMEWLCPQVADAHGPYKGYDAGAVINDHDVALSYVMEYYPTLLPSYTILSPRMQQLVLFTQSKMQFNHGWFVQAEAPPGKMLGPLKSCMAAAQPGDLPFYFFHWLTDLSGAEGTPLGGAEKFVLKFPEPVLAAFLWSIPYLDLLGGRSETKVMEQYLVARWQSAFPDVAVPTGPSSIALLRLAVMAQGGAGGVVEAFRSLQPTTRAVLSEELARTGCQDQHFESCSEREGGPAFLIYYGPALLQRCRDVDEMKTGLQILAATCAAGRGLWPLSAKSQGNTVVIDVGHLRTHDVQDIAGGATESQQRSIWVMFPKNEREASLELIPSGEINKLNRRGDRYWVLDMEFGNDRRMGSTDSLETDAISRL